VRKSSYEKQLSIKDKCSPKKENDIESFYSSKSNISERYVQPHGFNNILHEAFDLLDKPLLNQENAFDNVNNFINCLTCGMFETLKTKT
jgi:hypothetical protein